MDSLYALLREVLQQTVARVVSKCLEAGAQCDTTGILDWAKFELRYPCFSRRKNQRNPRLVKGLQKRGPRHWRGYFAEKPVHEETSSPAPVNQPEADWQAVHRGSLNKEAAR